MFRKPFRVKSNSIIKGSDRKKLRSYLGSQFPQLSSEELSTLISNKDEMQQSKLYTHSGESVIVYIKDNNPVFFELDKEVFPTVYTLWSYTKLMPSFTTWPPVFENLSGGADLMLPGVILKDDSRTDDNLANLRIGQICSIKLLGNTSPVGIGKSLISEQQLFGEERKGKAVNVLHTYGDYLWASGEKTTLPIIEDSSNNSEEMPDINDLNDERLIDEVKQLEIDSNLNDTVSNGTEVLKNQPSECIEELEDTRSPTEIMDELFLNCLLSSFKTSLKKVEFPLLVSTFHKSHLLPCCPANQTLDVKKSSYKKLSVFLREMQKMGLLEVKELQKGVESIISVNLNHQMLHGFKVEKASLPNLQEEKPAKIEYSPPQIQELFVVSAAVLPIFSTQRISKGRTMSAPEVRQFLTNYVKNEDIQKKDNPNYVTLDPILAHSLLNKSEYIEHLKWEELYSRCFAKMSTAYEVALSDGRKVTGKGTIPSIEINIAQRSGNKKVTLIYNLETYGIDPDKFAHQVQVGVAASTSVSHCANKKCIQVLIQGNQTKFVGKLLLDEYKIPKKFVIGLDKHASSKKK